ncbi:endo-1,4-beta-xylanase [Natronobiforma cellulositropha]|uniref:endo-1,4-beta-xylanase n=1 Tax=Natronobiforma cellulositropha TaxID=1679076 RepID=UPI0021D5E57C|nr:endo-1,4-beta-xylanase [Natronobiforma cellulositropha]
MSGHDSTSDNDARTEEPAPRDDDERIDQSVDSNASATMDRRDYLRSVGIAGVLGAVGGIAGPATGTAAADANWEADADQRIADHRQSELEVAVVDEAGNPVSDADVSVEMREHAFGWGTALTAPIVTGDDNDISDADREQYLEVVPELFNTAVFGNYHKWRFFEDEQHIADEATAWVAEQGLRMRGHTCVWGNVEAWAVPGDVVDAMDVSHESGAGNPQLDPDHVYERSMEHIETIIEHYADFEYDGVHYGSVVDQWDVVNEAFHETDMIEVIDGDGVEAVEAPVLAEWYEHADAVAPDGVATDVNDYNTLAGAYEYARGPYERQIEFLVGEDTGLDGAGLQCHFHQNEQLTPSEIWEGLERYAQHGVELRITEFDFDGDGWSEEDRAEFFYEFLKMIFSHPSVTDFVMWGFWDVDDPYWDPQPPLFYEDWTPKPSYDVWMDLVFDEWWTDESGTTDASGTFTTDAFLGEHEVTVTVGDETVTETVSVDEPDSTGVTVVIDDGDDGDSILDVNGDGNPAQDLTGDGRYEDVTGDGNLGFNDVVTFFEEHNGDVVQNNVQYFDFSGNGSVGFNDVVALFERL